MRKVHVASCLSQQPPTIFLDQANDLASFQRALSTANFQLNQRRLFFAGVVVWAASAVQMVFKLFTKLFDEGDGGHGGGVAEGAEGAAQHVFSEVADVVDVPIDGAAFM